MAGPLSCGQTHPATSAWLPSSCTVVLVPDLKAEVEVLDAMSGGRNPWKCTSHEDDVPSIGRIYSVAGRGVEAVGGG